MKADRTTELAVLGVLNQINRAYETRDIDGLLAICAPDADVVMFGTGADERRIGRDEIRLQAERDWSQTDSSAFEFGWVSVSAAGPVAWLAAEGSANVRAGGQELRFPVRMSGVFEKRGDQWLMTQAHYSFPAAGQDEGESFPSA